MNIQRARPSPRQLALAVSGIACLARTWMLALLLALLPLPGMAAPAALTLDDAYPHVEGWDAITVLHDPAGTLVADALLRAPERFAMPQGAHATLGMQDGAVWLRVPAMVAAGSDGAWVLKVDFGLLSHVELYLARDGRIVEHRTAGSDQYAHGALGGPVPAFLLHLEPGVRYDVLLRVETISAMIVPVSFEKPSAFYEAAMDEQLLQGALTGLTLCLLLYSLAHWISLRDNLFGKYALLIGALALYNFAWFGYGRRYLWGSSAWGTLYIPGIITLLTACGGYLFVEHALARPGRDRIFSRLMKGGALLCVASASAWGLDLISRNTVVAIITTLGVLPMLLGLPGAFRRARANDAVGICFLVGWSVSFACTALAGQICTGVLGANYWTMHLLQFGSTFDMLVFMRILGLRIRDVREAMPGAACIGAGPPTAAATLDQELRGSRRDHLALLVPEVAPGLDAVLDGLQGVIAQPPAHPLEAAGSAGNIGAAGLAALVTRLDEFLEADDARAEDALDALRAALPPARLPAGGAALLDALRGAVREREYEAARAHLARLARSLEYSMAART